MDLKYVPTNTTVPKTEMLIQEGSPHKYCYAIRIIVPITYLILNGSGN